MDFTGFQGVSHFVRNALSNLMTQHTTHSSEIWVPIVFQVLSELYLVNQTDRAVVLKDVDTNQMLMCI